MNLSRARVLTVLAGLTLWAACSNPNLSGGKLHFDQKRYDRARDTFAAAVKEMPTNGEPAMWLGRAYAELDRPDSASMYFDMAVQRDPSLEKQVQDVRDSYWAARYNSAIAYATDAARPGAPPDSTAMRYRAAARDFKKAEIYSNTHPETPKQLGVVYFNMGKTDSALVYFEQLRLLSPEDTETKAFLFDVYFRQGNTLFAKASDQVAAQDTTGAIAGYRDALKLYEKSATLVPDDTDLRFQIGATHHELSYLEKNNVDALRQVAIDEYKKVLATTPDDVDVMFNLASLLRDMGQYKEAKEVGQKLLDMRPKEAGYHDFLGRVEDKLGNKTALVSGIVFSRALKNGTNVAPAQAAERIKQWGTSSDISRRYREGGAPEDLRTFTDTQGQEYETWFYWTRGVGYAFVNGEEKYQTRFAKQGAAAGEK